MFYALIISLLNTITSHTLLTRKRSLGYCVIAFIVTAAVVNLGVMGILRWGQDPMIAKMLIYFMAFLFIGYIHLVFSESFLKKLFAMFSVWVFSTVIIFIAMMIEQRVPLFYESGRTVEIVYTIRYIIQILVIFACHFWFSRIYKRVLDIVPDRSLGLMSLYLIMAFLLLINSFPKITNHEKIFSSMSDMPLFLAYIVCGYLVVFLGISSSSEIVLLQSSLKRAEKQSEFHYQLANYDALTGIASRLNILNQLSETIGTYGNSGQKFAVLLFDVDHFKGINDRYGHQAGDYVLKALAEIVKGVLRNTDSIGRFGGDEFVILQQNIRHGEDSILLIDRIFAELKSPILIKGERIQVSVSIGISIYPCSGVDLETLINQADSAMYESKRTEGCSWRFFKPEKSSMPSEAGAHVFQPSDVPQEV